ncbi:MAG: radical SAM protein [Selenomonadaceae bacterium]|nr:radical SAM protein [Selenomonadaceae bacterium]
MPQVNFFEFRRLISTGKLGGLILNIDAGAASSIIKECKFYGIPNVCIIQPQNIFRPLYLLDTYKGFLRYAETNLIDSCNLNCSGCTHYANLFDKNDFYPIEKYERDIKNFAAAVDVLQFRLLGGEPLKLPNLIDYIKLTRKYFPQTDLRIATNGLMIPSAPQDLLDAIRENQITVDITIYPPTEKVIDKVQEILNANGIYFTFFKKADRFIVFLSLNGGHNPEKSRRICINDGCRFMRDGKIYKCPIDALSYKFAEKFGLKGFPKPTGVTIGTPNFVSLLERLNDDVECCYWCNETARIFDWKVSNKPALEEWLANPMETLNLCRF